MSKNNLVFWLFISVAIFLSIAEFIFATSVQKTIPASNNSLTQGITQINSIGGQAYDMAVQDGYLYVTIGARLEVFDVWDSTKPVRVAQSSPMPSKALGLSLANGYAYVANGLGGVHIFDIHTERVPIPVGFFQTEGIAEGIKVTGNYAFVASRSVFDGTIYKGGGLDVIDISDPNSPSLVGNLPINMPRFHSARIDVVENIAYFGKNFDCGGCGELLIIDISDPAVPTQINTFTFPEARGGVYDLIVRDDIAFITSQYRLYALNVTNPMAPVIIGAYGYASYGGRVSLSDDYAYITNYNSYSGIHVIDASDPTQLTRVALLETGFNVTDVTSVGNTIYSVETGFASEAEIEILDVTDPIQSVTIGVIDIPSLQTSFHLTAYDNYLYTSEYFNHPRDNPSIPGDAGHIVDVVEPASATIVDTIEYSFIDTVFAEDYGYWLTSYTDFFELQIISMIDPQNPQLVGNVSVASEHYSDSILVVNQSYAYIQHTDKVYVFDISDLTQPFLVTTHPSPHGSYLGMTQKEDYLYLISLTGGFESQTFLEVLDITTPGNPVEAVSIELLNTPYIRDLVVNGNYVYASTYSEIEIIDITNPFLPVQVGSFDLKYISKIEASNDHLFVLQSQYSYGGDTFVGGLRIFSVTDTPTSPVEVAFHQAFLYPQDIAIDWNMIYTANGSEGVFAFWFAPPAVAVAITNTMTTLKSPFDKTTYNFPTATFSDTVAVTHTAEMTIDIPVFGALSGIDHNFTITAVYSNTGQQAEVLPDQTYTVTVHYDDAQRVGIIENSLALYHWDGQTWQAESSSIIDSTNNTVTATLNKLGHFSILGESYGQFLPIIDY